LGKWGANHAADPLITQKGEDGQLYFLMIKRVDNGQWALPGGMLDSSEAGMPRGPMQAALRELFEEAGLDLRAERNEAKIIYQGYVDDPRNTDNAWMETVVYHIHLNEASLVKLTAGDDASVAKWAKFDSDDYENLFASHKKFIDLAAEAYK
jgi:ADP-ribose pyrophosphatase